MVFSGSFVADGPDFVLVQWGTSYNGNIDNLLVGPATGGSLTNPTDGGYWEYISTSQKIRPEWFGGKADSHIFFRDGNNSTSYFNSLATDNRDAFHKAADFISTFVGSAVAGGTVELGYGGYYISDEIKPTKSVVFEGIGQGYYDPSSRIYVAAGKRAFSFNGLIQVPGQGSQSFVSRIGILSLGTGGRTDRPGIDMNAAVTVEHCFINGFGGDGICIDADINLGEGANCFYVNHCAIWENAKDGIFIHGGDSNAGYTGACNFIANKGWALNDDSFLANYHCGHHAATCGDPQYGTGGPYRAVGLNGPTVFIGCYSEGDMPPSYAGNLTTFIGGLHGSGVITDGGVWEFGRMKRGGMFLQPKSSAWGGHHCYFDLVNAGSNVLYSYGVGKEFESQSSPINWTYVADWGFLHWWAYLDGDFSLCITPPEGAAIRSPRVPVNNTLLLKGAYLGGESLSVIRKLEFTGLSGLPSATPNIKHEAGDCTFDPAAASLGWICSTNGIITSTTWTSGTAYTAGTIVRTPAGKVYQCTRVPYDPDAWSKPGTTVMPTHTTIDQTVAYPEPNPQIDPGEGATIPGYSWNLPADQGYTDWIWHSGADYWVGVYVFVPGPNLYYRCVAEPTRPTPIFNQAWAMPNSTLEPTHTSGIVEYPEPNPSPSGSEPATIPGYKWEFISSNPAPVWTRMGQKFNEGSITYDAPSLADGARTPIQTITVTGAILGDAADVTCSIDIQGVEVNAWVSAANTVSFRLHNRTGGVVDLGSATYWACARRRTI